VTATAEAPTGPADDTGDGPSFLDRPLTSLHLLLVCTGLLLGLGMVMVLSASMVKSYKDTGSAYSVFAGQAVWVALALPAFWFGVRLTPKAYRRLAYPALLVSLVLLAAVLVPGVGLNLNGAQRWLDVGPLQMQPAELAKLALALWGADLLVRKKRLLGHARHLVMPLVPVAALMAALVVLEPDLGTSMCFAMVLFGLLWTVGAPARIFGALLGLAAVAVAGLALVEPYRFARVTHFLDPSADPTGTGFQPLLGLSSLSSGGWFGVGLGQGRAKWLNLPEAHTDYIFAVIGEELGLLGSMVVLLLYATLAYAGLRVARRTADPFARLAAAAVTVWIVGQAVLNIGYVSGLLPVTGVPLPLISAGGTSLLVTVFALGMLTSFARHEPDAVAVLGKRGRVAKLLGLPAPRLPRERRRRRIDRTGDRGGRRLTTPPPRTAGSARPSRQTSPRPEARRR
jgi:cell division protein FtsW